MTDFWRDSGFGLLERKPNGHLVVTDDFLRAYFQRPEIRPPDEACAAERALHEALLKNPREAVSSPRLDRLADSDARNNYRIVLDFRDRLVKAGTLEACYLDVFLDSAGVAIPPLFVEQMSHVILRSQLDGCADGLRLRAAETLFRSQKVTINDGSIMAADAETVDMFATTGGFGNLGQLVAQAQTPLRTVDLDVIGEDNADIYWDRDSRFDTVLNLNFAGDGLDALCRVLEGWVRHFLDVAVSIQPVQRISDEKWVWHIGLDAEGSALLNDLYNGVEVGEGRLARLLSLFRLDVDDPALMPQAMAGRPIYLAMCMTEDSVLRLKPQNLLVNLPLAERA